MGVKKCFAEIRFSSMFPGDLNKSLGIVETKEFKIDSISKYLKDLEIELESKIKEAMLWEMAFTKDAPDSMSFHLLRDGRIVDTHSVPFKGRFELSLSDTEEDILLVMKCVDYSSKDAAKGIVKKLCYEIIHSTEFATVNKN